MATVGGSQRLRAGEKEKRGEREELWLVEEVTGGRKCVGAWCEFKAAMHQHYGHKVPDQGDSLGVEIFEHGVRFLLPHKADNIGIDVAAEQCHCTTGMQGLNHDVGGFKA